MSFIIDRVFVQAFTASVNEMLATRTRPSVILRRQLFADLRMAEIEFWDAVERSMMWHARRA